MSKPLRGNKKGVPVDDKGTPFLCRLRSRRFPAGTLRQLRSQDRNAAACDQCCAEGRGATFKPCVVA